MRTLRFHRALYSEAAIQASMDAFSGHAKLALRSGEPYAHVDLEATVDIDQEELSNSFANYVLARTIEEKRGQ